MAVVSVYILHLTAVYSCAFCGVRVVGLYIFLHLTAVYSCTFRGVRVVGLYIFLHLIPMHSCIFCGVGVGTVCTLLARMSFGSFSL